MASLAVETSIHIDRPVDEVFEFVSDPANMSRWVEYVADASYSDGTTPEVGATYDVKYTYGRRVSDLTMEVTEFDPPKRFGYKTVKGPLPDSRHIHPGARWQRHPVHILPGCAVGQLHHRRYVRPARILAQNPDEGSVEEERTKDENRDRRRLRAHILGGTTVWHTHFQTNWQARPHS